MPTLTKRVTNPIMSDMWSPLRLLLVMFALFGLVGQTAAYAMAPLASQSVSTIEVAAPSTDCAGMMMPDGDTMPCEGITLDCIADMGCIAPPALAPSAELSSHAVIYERVAYEARRPTFAGLTVSPEIFPPIA